MDVNIAATGAGLLGLTGFPQALAGAGLIFICRVTDMSIDTLRVISMVRGHKIIAAALGFMEAAIFIFALVHVLRPPIEAIHMLAYAAGFGTGTLVGLTIAGKVSSSFLLVQVVSRSNSRAIGDMLREIGLGVTAVSGEGRQGTVPILFSVIRRAHAKEVLKEIRQADPKAFLLMTPIERAFGGFVPPPGRFLLGTRR